MLNINSLTEGGLYQELLTEFETKGDEIYIVSPTERRNGRNTHIIREQKVTILKVWIFNNQKSNLIEKGFSTILLEWQFRKAIEKYFNTVTFDLILYSTPPVTFVKVIQFIKKRDGAYSYLLLKDIFPQNAVDLKLLSKYGLLYWYFRRKEKQLYAISDAIGCMSPANARYLLDHNPELPSNKIEINPNSMLLKDEKDLSLSERNEIRCRYCLPLDKKILVYGGNLGKPQAVPFIIECIRKCATNTTLFFVIVGKGTEAWRLVKFIKNEKPMNLKFLDILAKDDYDRLVSACDVGLIFLDYRFTIPNYPSRILTYLKAGLPVLAATDSATDIGAFLKKNEIGLACRSDDANVFLLNAEKIVRKEYPKNRMRQVLADNFSVSQSHRLISLRFYAHRSQ